MTITSKRVQHDDGMIVYRKQCTTRREAIRVFCMECMGLDRLKPMPKHFEVQAIDECTDLDCPLYPFRRGKNPFTRRKGNIKNLSRAAIPSSR